jgi:hypothetical protein
LKAFAFRAAIFAILLFAVCEVLFRTVVPATETPLQAQDPQYGILHRDTTTAREGHFTVGRLARYRYLWRVNNFGWNSAIDYAGPQERVGPCAIVIGDSYIEGLFCDVRENLCAQLQDKLGGLGKVYNLGYAGSPFSQSLLLSRYAQHHFAPSLIVVVVSHGGVRRSLRELYPNPTVLQLRSREGVLEDILPSPYSPRRLSRLALRSAVVRYLWMNAAVIKGAGTLRQEAMQRTSVPTHVDQAQIEREQSLERSAAEEIVRRLVQENAGTPVLIVVDADRQAIYDTNKRPAPIPSAEDLRAACAQSGAYYLDLTDAFFDEWRLRHKSFNFSDNYHWNPYGYGVVASALAKFISDHELLQR